MECSSSSGSGSGGGGGGSSSSSCLNQFSALATLSFRAIVRFREVYFQQNHSEESLEAGIVICHDIV